MLNALMLCDNFHLDYSLFCNLVDLRILIECEAAKLASIYATNEELETLMVLVHCIRGCTIPADATESIVRFHYLLTQYSGNAVYAMTYKSFENVIARFTNQHLTLAPDMIKTVKLHESLLRALEIHDPEASVQCVRLCIQQSTNALKTLYYQ